MKGIDIFGINNRRSNFFFGGLVALGIIAALVSVKILNKRCDEQIRRNNIEYQKQQQKSDSLYRVENGDSRGRLHLE